MKTALLSVSDKTGILEFAQFLVSKEYRLLSTGGTFKYLKDNGLNPVEVKDITNFPEILDGRVKSLHPSIHGGILAKRNTPEHMETIQKHGIDTIDLVAVNLYPFFENAGKEMDLEQKVEFIDIGGPSMLRSAAKSFFDVTVVCNASDYQLIQSEIEEQGNTTLETRKMLAGKVFNLTAAYDAAISRILLEQDFPDYFVASYKKVSDLRYGENPHQKASYYVDTVQEGAMKDFEQLGGKELSFNNIRDMDLAWKVVCEFKSNLACCAVKHSTPCGVAIGETPVETYTKAHECDPVSIFGGIVAMNYKVDKETADELVKTFLEIVVAVDFDDDALKVLKKKKNLRIIKTKVDLLDRTTLVKVDGGLVVQSVDNQFSHEFKTVTESKPSEKQLETLIFAQKVCKYVKSNAIVVANENQALGIGGGKVNRIWAAEHALKEARKKFDGDLVMASDAFFPFRDVVDTAKQYGIKAIIQPGGSMRDEESIEACNEYDIPMVFTGMRHFLH
ncbi:MAG: bifunctional phosphoribosylaminoimidazolecarboxamide formyltransferase/IMP cyclohydrolase [Flavobacteriales bacterium]|nr:bifunctional phosphoribosylaminoimidazolecarboxamide formyltransferase/IMP cyclohydrolase [Flavobacteriales bacterium]